MFNEEGSRGTVGVPLGKARLPGCSALNHIDMLTEVHPDRMLGHEVCLSFATIRSTLLGQDRLPTAMGTGMGGHTGRWCCGYLKDVVSIHPSIEVPHRWCEHIGALLPVGALVAEYGGLALLVVGHLVGNASRTPNTCLLYTSPSPRDS